MNLLPLSCRRFRNLVTDRGDREFNEAEVSFLDSHRLECINCAQIEVESETSLEMLRMAAVDEVTTPPHFDERLIRQIRTVQVKDSLNYWIPALAGACVACLAIFSMMAMFTQSKALKTVKIPGGAAFRSVESSNAFRDLDHMQHLIR